MSKIKETSMIQKFLLAEQFMDPNLESDLLNTIRNRPDYFWEIFDLLPVEALSQPENRQLYHAIIQVVEKGQDQQPQPSDGKVLDEPHQAAEKLVGLYQKRLLADLLQESLETLHETKAESGELIERFEDKLLQVQQAVRELRSGQAIAVPNLWPDMLKDVVARHEAVKLHGHASVGLPTGISELDELLGGLQTGIHLLAAEPGLGKTTFSIQLASHVSQAGFPVLFISFEESLPRLSLKALCHVARLEVKRFTDGYGEPSVLETAAHEYGPALNQFFMIEGTGKLRVSQIKARALQLMNRTKTNKCLIIVDYLQRWAASRRDFSEFRHVVSSLVSELRELSFRLDSPVLVISSQNRGGQGGSSLGSLKESGDLEYSADTVSFLLGALERKATPPVRAVDLKVEKNRYGDKGKIDLIFRPDIGNFKVFAKW